MDTVNTLVSSAITTALYILYKLAQRYYFKSACNNNKLEIEVQVKDPV